MIIANLRQENRFEKWINKTNDELTVITVFFSSKKTTNNADDVINEK